MTKRLNIKTKKTKPSLKKNNKKSPFWYYILLVCIPILFFFLLEIGLRIFSYGRDPSVWVDVSGDTQILNPEVSRRYFFSTKNIPFSIESFIDKEKKENSFRVFVLGASSGAGYPYLSSASMSKFIRKKLEILYPERRIEVCNISMAAINSYAIRDLVPEIIKKHPDLVLVYLGHNEYYGALGVGSFESLGTSRFIVNTTLWLNKFKTVELLRNIIKMISGLFSTEEGVTDGTLMSRMAKDKLIKYKSDIYWEGIEQFEGNLRDILSQLYDESIPVIGGTLVSNLKDQSPFVSANDDNYPAASEVFLHAKEELVNGNNFAAESLFVYAKELDALRFRAPDAINKTILKLFKEFDYPVADVDSLFNSLSPGGIVGNNLMTDHLHPNVRGYQLMGNLFFGTMKKNNFLPPGTKPAMNEKLVDSLVTTYYNFTPLDSTIANFRIKILKNDWPYINPEMRVPRSRLISLDNFIDSTSLKVIDGLISRDKARLDVSAYYLKKRMYNEYSVEMYALIEEFPFLYKYYNQAAENLIKSGKFSLAFSFLQSGANKQPDAFNTKWLGIINLSQKFTDEAIFYLEQSLNFNTKDPQVYFNLTGAYAEKKEFQKSLEAINSCLKLNPNFPRAAEVKNQLIVILGHNQQNE